MRRQEVEDLDTVPARIMFGARDDDTMPSTWAERGLKWLHDNRPAVFADMMLAIVGVDYHVSGRRNSNGNGTRP